MRLGGAAIFALITIVDGALAQGYATTQSNVGTLTCESTPDPEQDASALSCRFHPNTGPHANYSGTVRIADEESVPGKRVLIWIVVARTPMIQSKDLEGRFAPSTVRPGELIGGSTREILLRPLSSSAENRAERTIELSLSGVIT